MLGVLLGLPKEATGLSDIQRTIISAVARRRPDREIARELGNRAESTVRNHRFQLKRRFTQARILGAIERLLEASHSSDQDFVSFHADIPADDERIVTTNAEARAILARYTDERSGLRMLKFPRKEKEKLILLNRIVREFDPGVRYPEPEVNAILRPIYDDYVTVRRYLIEYRFLDRRPDGSEYWVHK
jgi:hypothetical protein